MDIVRNDDGTLIVPVAPGAGEIAEAEAEGAAEPKPTSRTLHPGEGGYDEALAEWDRQQHPDREAAVSTPSGREEAMAAVHAIASDEPVDATVGSLEDPEASAEALRHVLVGGVHAVEDFAAEVADAEGGDPLPPHEATKVIGEVLAEIDTQT
jgi:hypothetical protein